MRPMPREPPVIKALRPAREKRSFMARSGKKCRARRPDERRAYTAFASPRPRPLPRRSAAALPRSRGRSAGALGHNRPMSEPLHLVDTTMFWSPTGGGVRRYLQTKHDWLAGQPRWRHTIAVPRVAGSDATAATLPSLALPG